MKPFQHMTREQVESASREDMLAYVERFKEHIREANAECLRDCLERCPDQVERCADCFQNAIVKKVDNGVIYYGDGTSQPFAPA